MGEELRTYLKVLVAEFQLKVDPVLPFFHLGKFVARAAIGFNRNVQRFCFVPNEFKLLGWMNEVAGSRVLVEEKWSFTFVHKT